MTTTVDAPERTLLPGAEVIAGIRSLIIWAVVATALLSLFIRGGSAGCSGGIDGDGFIGRDGQPTDVEPMCGSVTMGPSPLLYALLAVLVIAALTRILGRAVTIDHALRIINNTRLIIVVLSLVALAVSYLALTSLRVDDWSAYHVVSPLPFAQFTVDTWPISQR